MADEIMFVRFQETNDNEGETWNWWLQRDGNEQQLLILDGLCRDADDDEPMFELFIGQTEAESVVDKLVQWADSGYYRSHNKVTGSLDCPAGVDYLDVLYKGGIRDLFASSSVSS